MRTFAKIIGYGLVLLFVAAAIGLAYKYTNGFNEDFKTFYIEYNGKQILTTENKMTFETDTIQRFDVKYTFDKADAEPKDYNVKIVSNLTKDFDFTVDGERYLFSKVGELTTAFDIEKSDTFFELYLPEGLSFKDILKKAYNGKTVSVPSDGIANNPYPFLLQISSYNDKVTYNIYFTFGSENTGDNGTDHSHTVEYLLSGDATNLSDISLTGIRKATAGETVSFTITIGDSNYSISSMRTSVMNSNEIVPITEKNGVYSFTMPQNNIYVWIYFEYTPPQDKTMYAIEYDTLGNGSMLSIDLDCPDKAAAGETVTFTVKLKDLSDVFDDYYPLEITHIVLNDMETGEEISDLGAGEGSFTFTMPEIPVTIMFYLMRI